MDGWSVFHVLGEVWHIICFSLKRMLTSFANWIVVTMIRPWRISKCNFWWFFINKCLLWHSWWITVLCHFESLFIFRCRWAFRCRCLSLGVGGRLSDSVHLQHAVVAQSLESQTRCSLLLKIIIWNSMKFGKNAPCNLFFFFGSCMDASSMETV